MNKLLNIALFGIALVGVSSCASDEPGNSKNGEVQGEKAYIKVLVSTPGDSSRADNYETGSEDEQAVKNARFLFYDSEGNFVSEGNVFTDGERQNDNSNIEYFGKSVLEFTTIDEAPAYVVTIFNSPEMTAPATLDEMQAKLTEVNMVSGGRLTDGSFVMSTTSFNQEESPYYFVTEIKPENIRTSADETSADTPLRIYIERVGAKVRLNLNGTALPNSYSIGEVSIVGGNKEEMFIKVEGWGLNGTNRKSYLIKHINTSWTDSDLGFKWNDASKNRSHWGMSYNYGDVSFGYPDEYAIGNGETGLDYITAAALTGSMANERYCFENTNTSNLVSQHYPSALTSVLIKGRLVNKDGKYQSLVKFKDVFYTHEAFIKYIYDNMIKEGKLKYLHNGEEVQASDFQVVSSKYLNGRVVVEVVDNSGWTTTTGRAVEATVINEELAEYCTLTDAVGYKDGLMYYSTPIKHLNQAENTVNASGDVLTVAEGHYGVVRNHIYSVTISEISHVGQGIQDENEPIVPNKNDNLYNLDAKINILSWQVVSQDSDL